MVDRRPGIGAGGQGSRPPAPDHRLLHLSEQGFRFRQGETQRLWRECLAAEARNLLHKWVVFRPILDDELDFDIHDLLLFMPPIARPRPGQHTGGAGG